MSQLFCLVSCPRTQFNDVCQSWLTLCFKFHDSTLSLTRCDQNLRLILFDVNLVKRRRVHRIDINDLKRNITAYKVQWNNENVKKQDNYTFESKDISRN